MTALIFVAANPCSTNMCWYGHPIDATLGTVAFVAATVALVLCVVALYRSFWR